MPRHKRVHDISLTEEDNHKKKNRVDGNGRKQPSPSRSNSSEIDDSKGHYLGGRGDVIKDRYEIVKEIGLGTFGKVYKCKDRKYNDIVAVKIIRGIKKYVDSAKIEASILDDVYSRQKRDNAGCCVKLYSHFPLDGFYCLVTERLGLSLYDFLKMSNYKGLPMRDIQDISRQLVAAMDFLRSMRLIHTDLKVENVLFVDGCSRKKKDDSYLPSSTRIKIIDFGGATYDDEHKSRVINTRQYRGPEVTLELGWSYPSDMWSVGCIIAEVYKGELLFQTHDSLEHIALMERAISPFPMWMIQESPVREGYFNRRNVVRWKEGLARENRRHIEKMSTIQEFFAESSSRPDRTGIAELVEGLLQLDPHRRLTPREALRSPFLRRPL